MESKNQELLAEIDRLKKETEELRLRRGASENLSNDLSVFLPAAKMPKSCLTMFLQHLYSTVAPTVLIAKEHVCFSDQYILETVFKTSYAVTLKLEMVN